VCVLHVTWLIDFSCNIVLSCLIVCVISLFLLCHVCVCVCVCLSVYVVNSTMEEWLVQSILNVTWVYFSVVKATAPEILRISPICQGM